jgi:predicted metal-binding membrane protein
VPSLEAILKRDRQIVLATIVGLVALSWAYLVLMARDMSAGDMTMMVQPDAWGARVAITMFLMWSIMMVGMMLPSAAPMVLLNAALLRQTQQTERVHRNTLVFLAGYLAIWTAFSAAATVLQWWLSQLDLLSPMMIGTSSTMNQMVLIAAGIYQWLPWKTACLKHCQTPVMFLTQHRRPGLSGAFRMGLLHGAYCVGCCWALMLLLFVGGVMNLLWIALLAGLVLVEKLLPWGTNFGRVTGVLMILAALWL